MIAVAAPGFLGHLPSNSDLGVNPKLFCCLSGWKLRIQVRVKRGTRRKFDSPEMVTDSCVGSL